MDLVTGELLSLKISSLDHVVPRHYARAVRRLIGASAYTLRALHLDLACSERFLPSDTSLPCLTTLRVWKQFIQHALFNKSPLTDLEIVCDDLEYTLKDDRTMNTVSYRFPSLSRLSIESPKASALIKVENFAYLSSVFPKLKHLVIRQHLDELSVLLQERRTEDVVVRHWVSKAGLHSFNIQYAWNWHVSGWHYVSTGGEVKRRKIGSQSGEAE
ncbi:hypothetical protein EIP86_002048 [Pleurotus ostreatoroseus]|nr:hypothetical protein EIP86_002048 [Pleurotus ostreatoroseus]